MVTISRPSEFTLRKFLQKQARAGFSYSQVNHTQKPEPVKGFNNDRSRILLGHGQSVYDAACKALRRWGMFPSGWAWIEPRDVPIQTGQTLAIVANIFGVHWLNACRIVYTLDGSGAERRFGFAYGTLPDHVETGEERFSVEWLDDDSVWYDLKAFSHPRLWVVWLGYPLARLLQKRFVRESLAKMKRAIELTQTVE